MRSNSISVVITSFNQQSYLKEAIESVLNQTLTPEEIIICDDASSDGSQNLIGNYKKQNPKLIKTIFHHRNKGIAKNRSSGIKKASANLISWLDGDDRYKRSKLEVESDRLCSDENIEWVYSQVDLIDERGNKIGERYKNPPEGFIFDQVVAMIGRAPRNPLIRHSTLRKIGLFTNSMSLYEDFDFILRLSKSCRVAYCPQSTVEYRIHSKGLHNRSEEEHIRNVKRIYENLVDLICDYPDERKKKIKTDFVKTVQALYGGGVEFKEIKTKRTFSNFFTKI